MKPRELYSKVNLRYRPSSQELDDIQLESKLLHQTPYHWEVWKGLPTLNFEEQDSTGGKKGWRYKTKGVDIWVPPPALQAHRENPETSYLVWIKYDPSGTVVVRGMDPMEGEGIAIGQAQKITKRILADITAVKARHLDGLVTSAMEAYARGEFDAAAHASVEALSLASDNWKALYVTGAALVEKARKTKNEFRTALVENAITCLENLCLRRPNYAEGYVALARAYEIKGEKEKVAFLLEQAIRKNPMVSLYRRPARRRLTREMLTA